MCTSYHVLEADFPELDLLLREALRHDPEHPVKLGRISPTDTALALTAEGARPMTFGMKMPGKKTLLLNARSERAEESPFFSPMLKTGRCLIPANDFYEWSPDKKAHLFSAKGNRPLYMAGLYMKDSPLPRYVVITKDADEQISPIHNRMPLLMPSDEYCKAWLNSDQLALSILHAANEVPLNGNPV